MSIFTSEDIGYYNIKVYWEFAYHVIANLGKLNAV